MHKKTTVSRGVSLALLMVGGSAFAQQSTETDQLEEITVTAQFRSQNLQETPLAITAVTGDMLEARSQTSIYEVAAQAPSVFLAPQAQANGSGLIAYIRGVGQTDFNFALEPGVGLYVDDVYLPTLTGSLLDLLDLDRVEILRGPQGTLSGRNSIGGAIKLFSKRAEGHGGNLSLTYGSYDRVDVRASGDFTLVDDKLFVRVAGVTQEPRRIRGSHRLWLHAPGFRRADTQTVAGLQTGNPGRHFVRRRTHEPALVALGQRRGELQRRHHQRQLRSGRGRVAPRGAAAVAHRAAAPQYTLHLGGRRQSEYGTRRCRCDCRFVPYGQYSCDPNAEESVPELRHVHRLDCAHQPAAVQAGGGARGAAARPVRHVRQHRLEDQRRILAEVHFCLAQVRLRAGRRTWTIRRRPASSCCSRCGTGPGARSCGSTVRSARFRLHGRRPTTSSRTVRSKARVDLNYAGIDFVHGPDPTPSNSKALFLHGAFHVTDKLDLHAGRALHRGREDVHLPSPQSGWHRAVAAARDFRSRRLNHRIACARPDPQWLHTRLIRVRPARLAPGVRLPVDRRRHDLRAGVDGIQGRRHQSASVLS